MSLYRLLLKGSEVGRLTDIESREVSLVDLAANQRKFLVVKNAQRGDDMTVQYGTVGAYIDGAIDRINTIKSAIEAAETSEPSKDPMPVSYVRAIRGAQYLLKGLAGITVKSHTLMVPCAELGSPDPLTELQKTSSIKIIDEVSRRLETFKNDLGSVDVLDSNQARTIDSTADLLAKIVYRPGEQMVTKASLTDEHRDEIVASIEKGMSGLCDLFIALQTDVIAKSDHVADQFVVGRSLHDIAGDIETAISNLGKSGVDPHIDLAIEHLRALQKASSDEDKARCFKAAVDAAEMVFKTLRPSDEKTADKEQDQGVVTEKSLAAEELREDEMATKTQGDVDKVGSPMQGDRLSRLKGAVKLLKEALRDLSIGSVNTEKFHKVGKVLRSLIGELSTTKMVTEQRGLSNERSVNPADANAGAGVQPDTSTISDHTAVVGAGTPKELNDILKMIDELKADGARLSKALKDRDDQIVAMKSEMTSLRKHRVAPSTIPEDARPVRKQEDAPVFWPRDMNDINAVANS